MVAATVVIVLVGVFGPSGGASYGHRTRDVARYLLGQRHDLGAPSMAVGIVRGQKVTDAAAGTRSEQPFIIASVTKPITALAVMQLVEAGRLRLDDPVVRYLPTFRTANPATSDRITVRELLTNTSGLSTAAGEDPFNRPATTLDGQVAALRGVTALQPGVFRYSSANFEVLGALVEQASGDTYTAYLRQHVLRPLRMRHTYTDLATARAHGLRQGHKIWFGAAAPDGIYYRADFLPAGMLVSTPGDLDHFMTAMLHGGRYAGSEVLSPEGVHTLLAPAVDASTTMRTLSYGMGWYQERVGGRDLVYAPGSAHNTHASIVLVPAKDVGVTVLADAESTLYYVLPKFELVAFNGAVLAGGGTPHGTFRGMYIVFDLMATAALVFYVRSGLKVARRRTPGFQGLSRTRSAVAVWRELVAPVVLLALLPQHFGFPWSVLIRSDVGLLAATVSILGLATLALRVVFWIRDRRSPSATATESVPPMSRHGGHDNVAEAQRVGV